MQAVVKNTLLIAIPIALGVVFLRDYMSALALFTGSAVACLGFALSMYVTTISLTGKGNAFFPIITNVVKAGVTAGIGAFFFFIKQEYVFFYIGGFVILFVGIYRSAIGSAKEMK